MNSQHIISQNKTLLEALNQINSIVNAPLVLFIIDENGHMVGTLTDGDSRRALITGVSLHVEIKEVMHRNFHYLTDGNYDIVLQIQRLREIPLKLIPVLNKRQKIVDIIDLSKYKTRLPIDAVLMAGGKGERLRPLTERIPKPLLPVGGKAIIDHNIDRLISYGIKHISVTVNYLKEQIEEHFREPIKCVHVQTVRESKYFGTIGSIRLVKKFYNDTILVMNSDLFTNINYEDFYTHYADHKADMSIVTVPYSIQVPYGIFKIENRRDITGLVEKPIYNYYANAGIYLIKKSVLNFIPKRTFYNATDLIETLITAKKKVIRFPFNGTWIDIGNPQEYKYVQEIAKYIY